MWQRKSIASQFGAEMATRIFRPYTTTCRETRTLSPLGMDTLAHLKTNQTSRDELLLRMIGDETNEVYPTSQINDVMSRRAFVKSAAAAAVLGTASPQVLMAETKEGMPQRALGRTGEKVSAIGLGGYHIGKQADETESITIMRSAIDHGLTFTDNCWDYNGGT